MSHMSGLVEMGTNYDRVHGGEKHSLFETLGDVAVKGRIARDSAKGRLLHFVSQANTAAWGRAKKFQLT